MDGCDTEAFRCSRSPISVPASPSASLCLSLPVFVSLRACDRLFIRVFYLLQLNMKKRKDKGQLRIDKKSSGSSNNRRNKKSKKTSPTLQKRKGEKKRSCFILRNGCMQYMNGVHLSFIFWLCFFFFLS